MAMTEESIRRAGEAAANFIYNMHSHELGIYTLRKAFEMGYLHGLNDKPETEKVDDEV
jgi:hypothetical protein